MAKTLTLGQIITHLEKFPPYAFIYFDFGGFSPSPPDSWRCDYSELAVGYEMKDGYTVKEFLRSCRNAVGLIFSGWKGGDYEMEENTPVWVDNWGKCTLTGITGFKILEGWKVIIETANLDPDYYDS